MTSELKTSMQKRDRSFRKATKSNSPSDWSKYKSLKSHVNRQVKKVNRNTTLILSKSLKIIQTLSGNTSMKLLHVNRARTFHVLRLMELYLKNPGKSPKFLIIIFRLLV